MLLLGIVVDFITNAPMNTIITLSIIGTIACTLATVLTYKRWLEKYVMYLVSAIVTILTLTLIMSGPVVTTYFLVFVNLAIMTLYNNIRAIAFSALLGAGVTAYVFLGPYRDNMFAGDSPVTVLLYLVMVAAPLLVSSRYSENLQAVAASDREQAIDEKNRTQAIVNNVSTSLQTLNAFSAELKRNVTATGDISREVTSAFQEVSSSSQEQAADITEISKAAGSIDEAASDLTERAAQMRELSAASANRTVTGSEEARLLEERMNLLEEATVASVQLMRQLSEQSQQIGNIVAAIKNISEQTNLLALNAAIEAARAGEHGRGFAVVSGEVRKLAETSQQATEQIEQILEAIRKRTAEASEQVLSGQQTAALSKAAAGRVAEALDALNEDAGRVEYQAEQVNISAGELRDLLTIVTERIAGIASITDRNMASIEQMASGMQTQDRRISEIVHSFLQLDQLASDLNKMTGTSGPDHK